MSRLAELLNPAPNPASETPSMASQASQVQPLLLDGRNHRSSFSYSGSPTHTRHPSITSPGLEALADAASNTAPIPSPKQHMGGFAHSTPFQPSYSHFGSRPSSSHTTLPPPSSDYSQVQHNSAQNSNLEQCHHNSSTERRISNVGDSAARLPPIQRSPTDQHPAVSLNAPAPLNGITDYANGLIGDQASDSISPHRQEIGRQELDPPTEAPITSQIRQPSPPPPQSLPRDAIPESQSEQVEVKAEIAENPAEIPVIADQPSEREAETSAGINSSEVQSGHVAGIVKETMSPMAGENATTLPALKPKAPPNRKRAAPKKGTASSIRPAAKKRKLDRESVEGTPSAQRFGTPATSRASNTPAPKFRKQSSVTPARSSSIVNGVEDGEGSEDDTEAYCICRKPDDHTLMIACDGPCEDWFHARCVSMDSAKAKLIYKWYCMFQVLDCIPIKECSVDQAGLL